MEKRNREKDLSLIRHCMAHPPTSRYAFHYLKQKYGIRDDRSGKVRAARKP
jgi:hypothetical protein